MSTSRPSSQWQDTIDELPAADESAQRIKDILTTANLDYLASVALETRRSSERFAGAVTCAIDSSSFSRGFHHIAVEVAFSDDVFWVARIQYKVIASDVGEAREEELGFLSEVSTMKIVRERTTIPVPKIFSYQFRPSEKFVYPYMLMEYVEGHVMPGPIADTVPKEKLPYVAKQIAKFLFDLENLTFDKLGKVWCGENGQDTPQIMPDHRDEDETQTSLEWFLDLRDDLNNQALAEHPDDPEWRAACEVLRLAMHHVILQDRIHGPFPLCHLDLHHGNLLFDDEYNLKGVIDWDGAQTVPLEKLACTQEFMTYPLLSDEENEPFIRLRDLVREYVGELEKSKEDSANRSEPQQTMLSAIVGTPRAEIVHKATYTFPHRAVWDAKFVAKLMWGDSMTWEDVVEKYS